jgi:hypothetical protein
VILEADASGDGSTTVVVAFYESSTGLTFNDRGDASLSAAWSNIVARGSRPEPGSFTVPEGLNKDGTLKIEGSGSIGTFDMSMSYFYLYRWQEQ